MSATASGNERERAVIEPQLCNSLSDTDGGEFSQRCLHIGGSFLTTEVTL
ncbi:hypothetical protein HSBAA_05870 [Vreelandella sulfidaeris]|uniref:Uncharacterized protein n=1 Tax=Vreelandella sulfidaeris TaxID=115553 RepID=A0A455U453_9GAMM|nr:hypothetical protein HSBAA_05870 [Halomonas sulfidaeris]